MKEPAREAMNVIMKMMMKKGELTGTSSGFKDLDALTWGFQRQEMIVLAARPSMGKTSLALNFAESAVMPKRGEAVAVLVFSLEMSAAQLALRMLCSRAKVNMKLLRDGLLSKNGEEQHAAADGGRRVFEGAAVHRRFERALDHAAPGEGPPHPRPHSARFHCCGLPATAQPDRRQGAARAAGRGSVARIKGAREGT